MFGADAWLSMKYIVSTCPIHSACTIQVVFGADADERIPYPDPDLKEIAERDFPDLVPVRVQHHPAHVAWAGSG